MCGRDAWDEGGVFTKRRAIAQTFVRPKQKIVWMTQNHRFMVNAIVCALCHLFVDMSIAILSRISLSWKSCHVLVLGSTVMVGGIFFLVTIGYYGLLQVTVGYR